MLQSNEEHMCKATALSFPKLFIAALPLKHDFKFKGAFTQSVLRGVIRRRLGYLINKKYFFSLKKRPFYAAYSALV